MSSEKSWNFVSCQVDNLDDSQKDELVDECSIDNSLIRDVLRELECDNSIDFCSDKSNNPDDLVSDLFEVISASEIEIRELETSQFSSTTFKAISAVCISILTGLIIKGLSSKENIDRLKRLASHILEHTSQI